MNLFNYLMNKNGKKLVDNNHMLEYLLNKSGREKEVSGTEITITDATKEKIIKLTLDKESTQDGIPTPENPVEVKTVKGYKNLFDINSPFTYYPQNNLKYEIENNSLTMEAIGTTGAQSVTYIFDGFDDTKNYTLSFKAKKLVAGTGNYARIQITIQGSNDGTDFTTIRNVSENTPVLNQEYSFNWTVTGYKYYRFLIYNDVSTPVQLGEKTQYYNILFTEGSSVLPYVPYGTNWVYTTISGKNLFNKNQIAIKKYLNSSGEEITDNSFCVSDYIAVIPGESYTYQGLTNVGISPRSCYYDENKNFVSSFKQAIGNNTITISNDIYYVRFTIRNDSQADDVPRFMIEKGTQATTYEAYKEKIATIPLNNNEIVGKTTNLDELIVDKNGHCWINKVFTKIDSYNGETITTDYWSTTGGLNTGATIYYVLDTPQLINLNYVVDIRLFNGVNNITNSDDMNMTLIYK